MDVHRVSNADIKIRYPDLSVNVAKVKKNTQLWPIFASMSPPELTNVFTHGLAVHIIASTLLSRAVSPPKVDSAPSSSRRQRRKRRTETAEENWGPAPGPSAQSRNFEHWAATGQLP